VQERRLRLHEQRVQVALHDRAGQQARAAGQRHRQTEARRDDTKQRQHVLDPPAAERLEAVEDDPPGGEEREVVAEHEHGLQPERAPEREARAQVRHCQRAREAQIGAELRHR